MKSLIFIASLVLALNTYAGWPEGQSVNEPRPFKQYLDGCYNKWSLWGFSVPKVSIHPGWDQACSIHDLEYTIIGISKIQADTNLRDNLNQQCIKAYIGKWSLLNQCMSDANKYYEGVKANGHEEYKWAQSDTIFYIRDYILIIENETNQPLQSITHKKSAGGLPYDAIYKVQVSAKYINLLEKVKAASPVGMTKDDQWWAITSIGKYVHKYLPRLSRKSRFYSIKPWQTWKSELLNQYGVKECYNGSVIPSTNTCPTMPKPPIEQCGPNKFCP